MKTLVPLLGRLPLRVLAVFGAVVAFIAGTILRIRRRHVETSMATAGIAHPRREARRMYAALGRSLAEFLWMAGGDKRRATSLAAWDDASRATFERVAAEGRGVVIAASHTGNWDLAACAVAASKELLVVTKQLHAESLNREWQRIRRDLGVTLVGANGAFTTCLAALHRGAVVAMMIDQVPMRERHATVTEFLGKPAYVDTAPAMLAARGSSPLIVVAARRLDDGRQVLSILDLQEPPGARKREWAIEATIRATRALDAFVRAHPSSWLWMHRRWRAPASLHRAATEES